MSDTQVDPASMAQDVRDQPDGPGKRIERRGEILILGEVLPGGAALYRERMPKFQKEAGYWEARVGTVHDLRLVLIDNDTRILFAVTYDGDVKPYVADILKYAGDWFDDLVTGVWKGYKGSKDPSTVDLILKDAITADFFYASNPELTVRDITKLKKLGASFNAMLEAVS